MSENNINNQILRIKQNIYNAYKVLENSGYDIENKENTDNLDDNMSYLSEGVKIVTTDLTEEVELDVDEWNVVEISKAIANGEIVDGSGALYQKKTYTITESDLDGNKVIITPDDDYVGMTEVTVDLSELIRILSEI